MLLSQSQSPTSIMSDHHHHQANADNPDAANAPDFFPPDMDFDQAFNQFTFDFKIQTVPSAQTPEFHHPTTTTTPPQVAAEQPSASSSQNNPPPPHLSHTRAPHFTTTPPQYPPNPAANAFSSLLSEQESWALNNFLDKVSVDPNFLFDPKVTDGLLNMGYSDIQDPLSATDGPHLPLAFSSDPNFPPRPDQQHHAVHDNNDPTNSGTAAANSSVHRKTSVTSTSSSDSTPVRRVRREGLSEDQKRKNHISSEKRRRDLIKQQFEKMCSLVPRLADPESTNTKSKSAVLLTVYEHLCFLIEQNKMFKNILQSYGVNAEI